jgi:HlyD family secretion protein
MKKRTKWIISILIGLVVLYFILKTAGVVGKKEGTNVAVETTAYRTIIETVNASGKIYPEVEVKVSPDISGEITELNVQEGDSVKKGQVLARIFADIYNSQEQQAAAIVNQQRYQVSNVEEQLAGLKSAMVQAEAMYKRQKQLLDDKVISLSEFETAENSYNNAKATYNANLRSIDAAKAGVQSAQASLTRASKDVSRATLTAPMDGVVSLLNVKKGERVVGTAQMAGTEMMRVADLSSIEVRVDVTENDIPKVHIGDSAIVNVDAYINRKFKGVVYQIASSQNGAINTVATTSTDVTNYKVFIRLLKSSYEDLIDPTKPRSFPFRPGMTASADIQTKRKSNVLSVPINAVTTRDKPGKPLVVKEEALKGAGQDDAAPVSGEDDEKDIVVFTLDSANAIVRKVPVSTGVQDTKYIEITSGLKAGTVVVTEPYNTIYKVLTDSMKVKVVDKAKLFEVKQ